MTQITVRTATADDASTIVTIMHAAFLEYQGVLDPPSGVHNEGVETVHTKMERAQWFIAFADERAVGCVMAEPRDEYMYLGRLAVLPAQRGRGIGHLLITRVEAYARELGFTRVRLGVRTALPAMRAAYERRGYHFLRAMMHEGFAEPTYVLLEKTL